MNKQKRKDFEIRFYEELLKKAPRSPQTLACLGDAYTRKGFYQEGLSIDRRLIALRPDDPVAHYNFACSLSLVGKIDAAFDALKEAVLLGYSDLVYMQKDPDLKNLKNDARFARFIEKAKNVK